MKTQVIHAQSDTQFADSALPEITLGGNAPIEYVPLSRLCLSPHNVRTKAPTGIEGLAENIAAAGLMQNLVVHPMKDKRGKTPELGVCAGQRRLRALEMLREQGRIDADYAVPVKIVSDAEAVAVSLIENQQREPMHPADASVAFRLLSEEGRSVEAIAVLFAIAPLAVRRALKLASVSPKLLAVYREDGMTYEQVAALSLTDDHAVQERLWFDAPQPFMRNPSNLREAITQTEIDAKASPLVAFVTLDAYEMAGGEVRRDLFSDAQNAGYVADTELLYRLVAERLTGIAREVSAEGWAWVETRTKRDYDEIARYGRLFPERREFTKKEKTEHRRLKKAQEEADHALNAYYDGDEPEDDTRRDQLEESAAHAEQAVEDFEARLLSWSDEQKAHAGAFIMVGHGGQLLIERGLVRREDRAAMKRDRIPGADEIAGGHPEKPLHGKDLCARLTAHRTAAVQVELARNPHVAVALLLARIVPLVFRDLYLYSQQHALILNATCSHDKLAKVDDMAASPAWLEISAERAKWAAMLPAREGQLLAWLLEAGDDIVSNLFAFCVASLVDGVSITDTPHAVNTVADVLGLDMTQYWNPTRASYLNHVSKSRIVEVVSAAVSPEAAAPLEKLKKDAAAETAERLLAGSRWLPEVLTNREQPQTWNNVEDEDDETEEPA
ncbi:ParB/RepB/Spo0J family partition protein [Trinickia violacea]|uniref:ParB/RepB/Spo0J family partition protein n=1 Tax=Trinickia violacea TaxID=2571746 RepID=A0A4P8J2B4_9BURK|nr:ParB/RepB/Spo0J family partition protein [Trinickia violacea]QCP55141.1 ParB/RepB/Spo0J family partition protein [Trinickia violacea]